MEMNGDKIYIGGREADSKWKKGRLDTGERGRDGLNARLEYILLISVDFL